VRATGWVRRGYYPHPGPVIILPSSVSTHVWLSSAARISQKPHVQTVLDCLRDFSERPTQTNPVQFDNLCDVNAA